MMKKTDNPMEICPLADFGHGGRFLKKCPPGTVSYPQKHFIVFHFCS